MPFGRYLTEGGRTPTVPGVIKAFMERKLWESSRGAEDGRPMRGLFYLGLPDALQEAATQRAHDISILMGRFADATGDERVAKFDIERNRADIIPMGVELPDDGRKMTQLRHQLKNTLVAYDDAVEIREFINTRLLPRLKALEAGEAPQPSDLRLLRNAQQDIGLAIGGCMKGGCHPQTAALTDAFFTTLNGLAERSFSHAASAAQAGASRGPTP